MKQLKQDFNNLPAWAKAVIGILNALVTIVLAMGINVGEMLKKKMETDSTIESHKLDYDNTQKTQKALTEVINKSLDIDQKLMDKVNNKEEVKTEPTPEVNRVVTVPQFPDASVTVTPVTEDKVK